MKQFDRTNTGTLGRNDRRETEKHPEYTGTLNVEGKEFWLSGWVKTAGPNARSPNSKFFSLSVKPREPKPAAAPQQTGTEPEFDDDIPF